MAIDLLKSSIESLKKTSDEINKIAEQSEDVKSGECTLEEELKEPAYVLFKQITESSIKILENEAVGKSVEDLSKYIGEDAAVSLVELLAITMTNAAYQAVLSYDDLLKKELTEKFKDVSHHINLSKADIEGHAAVLSVFRERVSDLENKMKKADINLLMGKELY